MGRRRTDTEGRGLPTRLVLWEGQPMTLVERLEKIESLLVVLVERQQAREWYSVEEFARIVGRAEFTCREWCRHGRIKARKKDSGRGAYASWAVSHAELLRYPREGLRSFPAANLQSETGQEKEIDDLTLRLAEMP